MSRILCASEIIVRSSIKKDSMFQNNLVKYIIHAQSGHQFEKEINKCIVVLIAHTEINIVRYGKKKIKK